MLNLAEGTPSGIGSLSAWSYGQAGIGYDPFLGLNYYVIMPGGYMLQNIVGHVKAPDTIRSSLAYRQKGSTTPKQAVVKITLDKGNLIDIMLVPIIITDTWQELDANLVIDTNVNAVQYEILNRSTIALDITMMILTSSSESTLVPQDPDKFIKNSFLYGLDDEKPNLREVIVYDN